MAEAEIGIFRGSGFYSFLEDVEEVELDTPYGKPSAPLVIGELDGAPVAFLPRHGREHELPPHAIPYRANVWAMRELGVRRIIGPNASGALKGELRLGEFVVCDQFVDRTSGRKDTFYDGPETTQLKGELRLGEFVVCDQFVDRTSGRKDTFYDGPETTHVSAADPYCPDLCALLVETGRELEIPVREGGIVVTIQGPRFSTRAESRWFQGRGCLNVAICTGVLVCAPARNVGRTGDPLRRETLVCMDSAAAIVLVLLGLLPAVLVGGLFVWAALKDGQEDRALQARLGIRRRTGLGR